MVQSGFPLLSRPVPGAAILAAVLALGACGASSPPGDEDAASQPGRLVIIGGALQPENAPVYQAVIDGRSGEGPLCVIPTASGEPERSMATAVERIQAYGPPVGVQGIFITTADPDRAWDPAVADSIASCSGFFFTGGSQSRVMDVFRPADGDSPAYDALMDRWTNGAVVAGTSAGAAMMSSVSITGGSSEDALVSGVRDSEEGEGLEVRSGMDFVPWALVDQHFLARGRWGRLTVATSAHPDPGVGVGIDENTALVVDGSVGRVVGESGVIWIQGGGGPEMTLHLLGRGDEVDVTTGSIQRSAGAVPIQATAGAGGDAERALGIEAFDRWVFLNELDRLASSTDQRGLRATLGDVSLVLEKGDGFAAYRGDPPGVDGVTPGLSMGPLRLRLILPGS